MAGILALGGCLLVLVGITIAVIQAFKSSFLEGMASVVIPLYVFYFVHKDWDNDSARVGFYMFLAGTFLYGAGVILARWM